MIYRWFSYSLDSIGSLWNLILIKRFSWFWSTVKEASTAPRGEVKKFSCNMSQNNYFLSFFGHSSCESLHSVWMHICTFLSRLGCFRWFSTWKGRPKPLCIFVWNSAHMFEKGTTGLVVVSKHSKHDSLSEVIGINMCSLTMETSSELLNTH